MVGRTLDSRTWQRVTAVAAGNETFLNTNIYTELGTAICYPNGPELQDSQEIISIVNGYGVATQGLHQAIFSPSITDTPAVDYWHAGERFQTRLLGLAYFDCSSGKSVLIAETRPSLGHIDPAPPGQVCQP